MVFNSTISFLQDEYALLNHLVDPSEKTQSLSKITEAVAQLASLLFKDFQTNPNCFIAPKLSYTNDKKCVNISAVSNETLKDLAKKTCSFLEKNSNLIGAENKNIVNDMRSFLEENPDLNNLFSNEDYNEDYAALLYCITQKPIRAVIQRVTDLSKKLISCLNENTNEEINRPIQKKLKEIAQKSCEFLYKATSLFSESNHRELIRLTSEKIHAENIPHLNVLLESLARELAREPNSDSSLTDIFPLERLQTAQKVFHENLRTIEKAAIENLLWQDSSFSKESYSELETLLKSQKITSQVITLSKSLMQEIEKAPDSRVNLDCASILSPEKYTNIQAAFDQKLKTLADKVSSLAEVAITASLASKLFSAIFNLFSTRVSNCHQLLRTLNKSYAQKLVSKLNTEATSASSVQENPLLMRKIDSVLSDQAKLPEGVSLTALQTAKVSIPLISIEKLITQLAWSWPRKALSASYRLFSGRVSLPHKALNDLNDEHFNALMLLLETKLNEKASASLLETANFLISAAKGRLSCNQDTLQNLKNHLEKAHFAKIELHLADFWIVKALSAVGNLLTKRLSFSHKSLREMEKTTMDSFYDHLSKKASKNILGIVNTIIDDIKNNDYQHFDKNARIALAEKFENLGAEINLQS